MQYLHQTSTAMWLPTPIYEALPYLYVLGGVLFFSGTLYIGLSAPGALLYLACGAISIAYGVFIFVKRQQYRSRTSGAGPAESA
jgi:hypothetical protein